MKVLLDTDIGSDIDDAVALAYLLAKPECELLGITTVSGEPVERARLASALCHVAGKEVPIYPGADAPLLGPQKQPRAPQAAALERWPHARDFPKGEAIEFLRRTVRAHPGEVTLLTIGPLTNAALLFSVDPEIPSLLAAHVMMGGIYVHRTPGLALREWNMTCDPAAASMVFAAEGSRPRAVGLEVTTQVRMDADEARERFQAPLLRPVLDFAEVWFRDTKRPLTYHDPLAAAVAFHPELCTFQRGLVEVETESDRLSGLTFWQPQPHGPHEIGATVNVQGFYDEYFGTVSAFGFPLARE